MFHGFTDHPFHHFVSMNKQIPFLHQVLPSIALFYAATLPLLPAQDVPPGTPAAKQAETDIDETLVALGDVAKRYVVAFNGKDAEAIAAMFIPSGEIIGINGDILRGRPAIGDHYREVFAGEQVPLVALEATNVRMIAPGIAGEEGVVHLTMADDEPVRSISYTVTHIRQTDGSWLIASSRSLSDITMPSERIKPLHWLAGDWTLESAEGMRIDMVIDLDERENFLLGEALVTDAMGDAQTTNLRIGWNPATSSVYWWTFDSEGGNASGSWSRSGDEWVVNSTGITAGGEATSSSQALVRDGDTMAWIATQRMLAGEAQPTLTYRFVRRAPDPLSLSKPETAEEPAPAPAEGE